MPQLEATRPLARKLSPALLILVALCFLLPFCSVSCGSSDVLSARGVQLVIGGDVTPDLSAFNSIANSFGSSGPSSSPRPGGGITITPSPSIGKINQSAGPFSPAADATKAHVDVQPLAIVALLAVLLAITLCFVPIPRATFAVAIASGVAAVALIALQAWLAHRFSNDMSAAQSQSTSNTLPITFSLTWSTWYYVALVLLILLAAWNAVLGLAPPATAVQATAGAPPPPEGPAPPGSAWPASWSEPPPAGPPPAG